MRRRRYRSIVKVMNKCGLASRVAEKKQNMNNASARHAHGAIKLKLRIFDIFHDARRLFSDELSTSTRVTTKFNLREHFPIQI